MADSVGSLIDKLITVDMKMFNNQEIFYTIRKMTFEEYKNKFFTNEDGAKELWEQLKKCSDLNCQRNAVMDELDIKIIEIVKAAVNGEDLDNGSFVQRKHKTY